MGSFLNVLILRLPRNQVITGRSHCPQCKAQLGSGELFPLVSYLALRGKCRHCGAKISSRYFWIEIVTASLFTLAFLILLPQTTVDWVVFVHALIVIAVCVVVFVIDLEHFLILDKVVFPAMAITLAASVLISVLARDEAWYQGLIFSLAGGVIGALPLFSLWLVSGGKWMGFGDVKFAGLMGMILGFPIVLVAIFLAFIIGALGSVPLLLTKSKDLHGKLPFGVFLTIASIACLFFGQEILAGYLKLIGW